MLFSALVAVSLALVSASPTPAIDHAGSLVAARTINDCETGTSDDHTSINSPLVEHCMQLAENILGDGTWYYTDDTKPRQLAQYKSCAFTVKLPECRGMFCLQQTASMVMVKIGNEDIRGAIHNAVDVAKKVRGIPGKPRVGAVGTFSCQGGLGIGGHQAIDWDLHWDPAYVEPGQVSRKSLPFEQRNVDAAQTINDCDNINRWWPLRGTDDSSPFIADCEKLADNIIGDGTWDLSSHGATRQLAQYKSCSFSAVSAICGGDRPVMGKVWCALMASEWIHIGNEDIRGAIHEAIHEVRMTHTDSPPERVGASGNFKCQTTTVNMKIDTQFYIQWNPDFPRS